MTATETNTQLVQQVLDSFKQGDIPTVLAGMTDDVQWIIPKIEGVSFSGERTGRDAVGRFFADLASQQDVIQFEPRQFVASEDEVVALGHYAWNVKATGRRWECDYAHVFTIRDGRVSRFREYTDTAAAAAAFRAR